MCGVVVQVPDVTRLQVDVSGTPSDLKVYWIFAKQDTSWTGLYNMIRYRKSIPYTQFENYGVSIIVLVVSKLIIIVVGDHLTKV